jgi:hypothetical protein
MKVNGPRRPRVIIVGVAVLLAASFGAGAWIGGDVTGRMFGSQALPRATATADSLHHKLLLLDRGEVATVREQIEMELDGELLGMCMLSKNPSAGAQEAVATARAVLKRIATHRSEKPPSYPKTYASLDPNLRRTLQGCLDEVRRSPGK